MKRYGPVLSKDGFATMHRIDNGGWVRFKEEKVSEVKKGDVYICIKDVRMNSKGPLVFVAGRIYLSEVDGCLTNEIGNRSHGVGIKLLKEHFEKKDITKINSTFPIVGRMQVLGSCVERSDPKRDFIMKFIEEREIDSSRVVAAVDNLSKAWDRIEELCSGGQEKKEFPTFEELYKQITRASDFSQGIKPQCHKLYLAMREAMI